MGYPGRKENDPQANDFIKDFQYERVPPKDGY